MKRSRRRLFRLKRRYCDPFVPSDLLRSLKEVYFDIRNTWRGIPMYINCSLSSSLILRCFTYLLAVPTSLTLNTQKANILNLPLATILMSHYWERAPTQNEETWNTLHKDVLKLSIKPPKWLDECFLSITTGNPTLFYPNPLPPSPLLPWYFFTVSFTFRCENPSSIFCVFWLSLL